MKRKTIISVAAIAVLIAATAAVIVFNNQTKQTGAAQTGNSMDQVADAAPFNMEYPDRLCGIPATEFKADGDMIEVRYGDTNFIRKALAATDGDDNKTEYDEIREQNVNGIAVTFKGSDGLVYLAVWNDNNFAYTVHAGQGVAADEMIEYIEATR